MKEQTTRLSTPRLLLAIFLAPTSPVLLYGALTRSASAMSDALIVSVLATYLLGSPAWQLLVAIRRIRWWTVLPSGFGCGVAAGLALQGILAVPVEHAIRLPGQLPVLLWMGLHGLLAAAVFLL